MQLPATQWQKLASSYSTEAICYLVGTLCIQTFITFIGTI